VTLKDQGRDIGRESEKEKGEGSVRALPLRSIFVQLLTNFVSTSYSNKECYEAHAYTQANHCPSFFSLISSTLLKILKIGAAVDLQSSQNQISGLRPDGSR